MDLNLYRNNKHYNLYSDSDVEWAKSILYSNFTEEWCNANQTNYYATSGYFPPNFKKTNDKLNALNALNLKSASPQKILDIGCGASHFVKLCNSLGHFAQGTEIKPVLETSITEIHNYYGTDVFELEIKRNIEFTLPSTYNIITGLRTTFNSGDENIFHFTTKDWLFLRDNLFSYLEPKGKVFFKTNLKFLKKDISIAQKEMLSAFGNPIVGFNTFTYLLEKI